MFTSLSAMVVAVTMTLPSASVFGATYSQELQDAYDWAYSKGVTTQSPIDNANMYGAITRAEMAKMLSVYAEEVLGVTADETKACNFTDIDSVKGDLHDFIIKSCKLGIMGQGITAFRPYDTLSRAEFGTALSRVLWGNKYEGGTPYYANHLNALKAAGIMNQIANAESTKEIRGYVMLMLMRSEGGEAAVNCDDEMIALACQLDACPAECKAKGSEDKGDDTGDVVKSGSLVVEADAASDRSAIKGAASDLDTLTFKTSEEVEITKVVLERYGYSAPADIEAVRLENSDGTIVAEEKEVNSKDQVTLSIKKDYRKVDGSEDWTIVVRLAKNASGSTIGFKVKDVTSTAKDNDFWNYKPYLYDIVTYDAVSVSLDDKGADKDYNYEAGEMYEVAKLKIKAGSSALEVNGLNLTNVFTGSKKVDLKDFLDKVEVSVNGKDLEGVRYTIDDDELDISFDSYEIEAKGNATFTVSISLKDFDEYGAGIEFIVKNSSDVKITEKKTWARVSVTLPHTGKTTATTDAALAPYWKDSHVFEGSKIKFSGKKLGNVDAAQSSTDIVVLEWEVEIAEAIDKWTFSITGILENFSGATSSTKNPIEEMTLVVNGDEYTATRGTVTWKTGSATVPASGVVVFTFNNVEIEESGKVKVLIDIDEDAIQGGTISFKPASLNKNAFSGSNARYTEARSNVKESEVKGSISFASKVTIQPSKASLTNSLSKRVEFTTNDSSKKTVFDGTYTAKKGTVKLNTALISGGNSTINKDATFYLIIDGEEVATLDPNKEETFSDIEIDADESVKVVVEAEINTDSPSGVVLNYSLELRGDDDNGNANAGNAKKNLVDIKVVEKGTFSITNGSSKNTVLLKARGTSIAQFTIKPSNNNEGLTLEDIILTGYYMSGATTGYFDEDTIRFELDGTEYKCDEPTNASGMLYYVNEELPSAGWKAEVFLEDEVAGEVVVEVAYANGLKQNKTFKKYFAEALAYITSQQNEDSFTQYFLGTDLYDDAYTISGVVFGTDYDKTNKVCTGILTVDWLNTEVDDNDDFTINNTTSAQTIRCISYEVWDGNTQLNGGSGYVFNNTDYADYFKVDGSSAWRVYANK